MTGIEDGLSRSVLLFLAAFILILSCGDGSSLESDIVQETRILVAVDSISDITFDSLVVGHLADACFGPSGEVLLLDQSAACVHVFADGRNFTGQIGGSGSGPGEMSNPMSVETVDGKILVRDAVKHGYLVFDREHSLVEEISHWTTGSPTDMQACGSDFAAYTASFISTDDGTMMERTVGRYRLGESEPDIVYYHDSVTADPTDITSLITNMSESLVFTADQQGMVYFARSSGEEYEITIYGSDGDTVASITRELDPVPKSQAELDEESSFMEAELTTMGVEGLIISWDPYPYHPMIKGLGVDSLGYLWVQRGTSEYLRFDVFDYPPSNEPMYISEFRIPGNRWSARVTPSGILAWDGDPLSGSYTVYLLKETLPYID